jgi:hypothetical protein
MWVAPIPLLFQASDEINNNAKNKLKDDITRRITFSPIISRKRNPPFASSERPRRINKLEATTTAITSRTSTTIKSPHPTLSRPRPEPPKAFTPKRVISLEASWNGIFNECLLSKIQPMLLEM